MKCSWVQLFFLVAILQAKIQARIQDVGKKVQTSKTRNLHCGLGPVHTGRGAPRNMRTEIMEHTAVNGSVHTGCKQHQRVFKQICTTSACPSCVNEALQPETLGRKRDPVSKSQTQSWAKGQRSRSRVLPEKERLFARIRVRCAGG